MNDGLINNDLARATSYEWPIPGMPGIGIWPRSGSGVAATFAGSITPLKQPTE